MLIEYFEALKDKPHWIEFNPWSWKGHGELSKAFFEEIGIALNKNYPKEEKVLKLWKIYEARLDFGLSLLEPIKNALSFFATVILPTANVLGLSMGGNFNKAILYFNATVLLMSLLFVVLSQFQKPFERYLKLLEANKKGLEDIKEDLSNALKDLKKPILIITDDIDRLSKTEIVNLFQLIKTNLDFPNMIHLMLLNRIAVESALDDSDAKCSGKEYLEKIVQVMINVPAISPSHVEKVLLNELDKIIVSRNLGDTLETHRWGNIYVSGIKDYFSNLRDVYRYVSMFSFHVGLFLKDNYFEVNVIDLMALEVIRIFEPKLFIELGTSKDYLLAYESYKGIDANQVKKYVEDLFGRVKEGNKQRVKNIFLFLFPAIKGPFTNSYAGKDYELWLRERRICHPKLFERYFQLTIPDDDIPLAQIRRIVDRIEDKNYLIEEFNKLTENKTIKIIFNRLEAFVDDFTENSLLIFLETLLEIGDSLPNEEKNMVEHNSFTNAWRLSRRSIQKLVSLGKIAEIISIFENTPGISLPMDFIDGEIRILREINRKNADYIGFEKTLEENDLKKISEIFVKRLEVLKEQKTFIQNNHLIEILHFWGNQGNENQCRKWLEKSIDDKNNLFSFLKYFVNKTRSRALLEDYVDKVEERLMLGSVKVFIDLSVIKEKIEKIKKLNLDENEKKLLKMFEEEMRRTNGGENLGY